MNEMVGLTVTAAPRQAPRRGPESPIRMLTNVRSRPTILKYVF